MGSLHSIFLVAIASITTTQLAGPVCGMIALAIQAQQQGPPVAEPTLDPSVRGLVDELLAKGGDPRDAHDAVYRACSVAHGTIDPLLRYVRSRTTSENEPRERTCARRLLARLQRRVGFLDAALRSLDELPASDRTIADEMARAEVLDALGKDEEALELYTKLSDRELEPEVRKQILLRRALMGASRPGEGTKGEKNDLSALAEFAQDASVNAELRNEAAIILALRGEVKVAIDTFEASGDGTERFRQEIRRAEWALDAELFEDAQKAAWLATENAKLSRDRKYALSVLASAYRRGKAVPALLERLEKSAPLSREMRELWVRLLREEGRAADALRLFEQDGAKASVKDGQGDKTEGSRAFEDTERRQLLEICRETGSPEVLVSSFERLIAEEPDNLEWRSGLSRHYLEEGEREKAIAVFADIETRNTSAKHLLDAAFSLDGIGLEELAERLARLAAKDERERERALMFVFGLHLENGQQDRAMQVLAEIDVEGASSASRARVADGYERLGRPDRAIATLESLRATLGGFLGTDLEMKLAILLSRVNREEEALVIWRDLWSRMRATPRGRFVEDRMMTVAARTGALAKIAIELEDKLARGEVDAEGVELLVRLYIRVNDPAAATEIVEEFMKQTGAAGDPEKQRELLVRKSKIYLSCQDYYNYERTIRELVDRDPENRVDHLRELAMSRLERGRLDLCVEMLPTIREASEDSAIADEFEAGVYGLCGMKDEALRAYVKGMGRHPERIDTYLLISNLMRETGHEMDAARMFQYLAQTADKDDLFTIAIDGLLNLRAQRGTRVPKSTVEWALRVTFERLATRSDKFYLYRLIADLAAELEDMKLAIRTLKSGIPVAGERRTPILREIMSKAQAMDPSARRMIGGQNVFKPSNEWDATDYIMVGRRLLGQGDHVPPQTFMNLATVFLREGDVAAAMRTFGRAAEVLEYTEVLREAARVLEADDRKKEALQFYRRLLAVGQDDPVLVQKVGSLEERLGNAARAFSFYRRGLAQVLDRKPRFESHEKRSESPDAMVYVGRNVSTSEQVLPLFVDGLVVTATGPQLEEELASLSARIDEDLKTVRSEDGETVKLGNYPRLGAMSEVWRKLALDRGNVENADALDERILHAFPADAETAKSILASRARLGLERSAKRLLDASASSDDPTVRLAAGVVDASSPSLTVAGAARLVVPRVGTESAELRDILERVETGRLSTADIDQLGNLFAACVVAGADGLGRRLTRAGIREGSRVTATDYTVVSKLRSFVTLVGAAYPDLVRALLREQFRSVARSDAPLDARSFQYFFSIDEAIGGGAFDSETARAILLAAVRDKDSNLHPVFYLQLLQYIDNAERAAVAREIIDQCQSTYRAYAIVLLPQYLEDEQVDDDFLTWFGTTLRSTIESDPSNTSVLNVRVGSFNARGATGAFSKRLTLKALEVLQDFQENPYNFATHVMTLVEVGRIDEAVERVTNNKALFEPSTYPGSNARGPSPWMTLSSMFSRGEDVSAVLRFVDKLRAKDPERAEYEASSLDLLRRTRPAEYRERIERALAKAPRDTSMLERLALQRSIDQEQVAALRVYRQLHEVSPDNPRYPALIRSLENRLVHPNLFSDIKPVGAVESTETDPKKPVVGGRASAGGSATGGTTAGGAAAGGASVGARSTAARPTGRTTATGATRATRATSAVPLTTASRIIPAPVTTGTRIIMTSTGQAVVLPSNGRVMREHPQQKSILELVEKGKVDEARLQFRELWRGFDRAMPMYGRVISTVAIAPGHLRGFAGKVPFLVDELQLILAALGDQPNPMLESEIYDILADAAFGGEARESTIDRVSKRVVDGTASTKDVEVLLRMLEMRKQPVRDELLEALLARTEPLDPSRLLRLVALLEVSGKRDRALDLYRLSAIARIGGVTGMRPVTPAVVESELTAIFGEDGKTFAISMLDQIEIDMQRGRMVPWIGELVDLWSRTLDTKEAIRRVQDVTTRIAKVAAPGTVIPMPAADVAVSLLARGGAIEDALAIARVSLDEKRPPFDARQPSQVHAAATVLSKSLEAEDVFEDRDEWLFAVTKLVLDLQKNGTLVSPHQVLAQLAKAHFEAGNGEIAWLCFSELESLPSHSAGDRLIVADGLRALGHEAEARAIEEKLLETEALPIAQIATVVRRVREQDGDGRAFALAMSALRYTWHADLLKVTSELAAALDRKDIVEFVRDAEARVAAKKAKDGAAASTESQAR
ncbi:MAG: hypothetical protein H6832_08455 [Planctomycetes bacterium]|nr:hypothetical protein [Planctomycetota bacterium]MCB9918420.1 hypothetical protein [Planctomycetota bacterium]